MMELHLIRGMNVLMVFTTPTTLTLNEPWRSFSKAEGRIHWSGDNVRNHRPTQTFTLGVRTDGKAPPAGPLQKVATHISAGVLKSLNSKTSAALLTG